MEQKTLLKKIEAGELICQCCGMPLDGIDVVSRNKDGSFNEEYCKWCYEDGKFVYATKEDLLKFMLENMPNYANQPEDVRRAQIDHHLSQLKHWR